jgi:D-lactate dehydrogenase (cytochrome)
MLLPPVVTTALQDLLGDRFSLAKAVRDHHGRDESPYPELAPDAVVFVQTNEEVASVVKLCNEHRVPLVAYGAGSSLEGHILPIQGGICLDLSQMNTILEIASDDFLIILPSRSWGRCQYRWNVCHPSLWYQCRTLWHHA